jgi:hypothetical protein
MKLILFALVCAFSLSAAGVSISTNIKPPENNQGQDIRTFWNHPQHPSRE